MTAGQGWEVIPARYFYASDRVDHLRKVYLRFLKAVSLARALKLTANETACLATLPDYRLDKRGWLNSLPAGTSPDSTTARGLLAALDALLDFACLKANLSTDDESLLTVLQDPSAKTPNGTASFSP